MMKLIKIREETKQMLDKLKQYPRETYDDVVLRLALKVLKEAKESG